MTAKPCVMLTGETYRTKSGVVYRKYPKGSKYKYQLAERLVIPMPELAGNAARAPFIEMHPDGDLELFAGYACDGPSGPTIDREENIRGGFGHDALYALHRLLKLSIQLRDTSDRILARICVEDGMNKLWAWLAYYNAVKYVGKSSAAAK